MELTYVSGGQRSGKSSYASSLVLQESHTPYYLATSRVWDDDFKQRIDRHKKDREQHSWINLEVEVQISSIDVPKGAVVLMDCVTLWLTNIFTDCNYDVDVALNIAKQEFLAFMELPIKAVVVSNEIGMGLHAETDLGRKFTDLQGWVNQFIAQHASSAFFMVSGLPLKLK